MDAPVVLKGRKPKATPSAFRKPHKKCFPFGLCFLLPCRVCCLSVIFAFLLLLINFLPAAEALALRRNTHERAESKAALSSSTGDVEQNTAFLEAIAPHDDPGQTWYSMRMNRAPRLLRLTATPDEKASEGKRWFQILTNFKPSVLKLNADSTA